MLISPKKVLWPTDFSPLALVGGRYARGFCDVFDAQMHVIHVIPPPVSPDVSVMMPIVVSEPELIQACRSGMEKYLAEHMAGFTNLVCEAFLGNPWRGVCEYAERKGIDLVVIATHGRTGLQHALIGSTAEKIVRHAPCPVLVVKAEEKDFVTD
jgi:nucleotide-binding universal stress UspA family protein